MSSLKPFISALLFLGLSFPTAMLSGCKSNTQQIKSQSNAAPDRTPNTGSTAVALVKSSKAQLFQLRLSPNVPIPLNKIHSWTLHVSDKDGGNVDNANIMIYGGMPAHKHGFPTTPKVTENLGDGRYIIDGIKFTMPGHWEIWINIVTTAKRDKTIFKLDIH